jgi:hypothetical protein
VLLGVEADDERRHVDDLLANAVCKKRQAKYKTQNSCNAPDVSLADKNARVMDGLGEARLEDLRLEAALQEVLDLEREHVIETHARLVKHANTDETTDERIALKETLRVLVVELKQLTRGTANLGENERDTPDLALVAEAVLAGELQMCVGRLARKDKSRCKETHLELGVETGSLVRPTRDLVTGARLVSIVYPSTVVDLEAWRLLTSWSGSSGPCILLQCSPAQTRLYGRHYLGILSFFESGADGGYGQHKLPLVDAHGALRQVPRLYSRLPT